MKFYVSPYKMGSQSAKHLARNLGGLRTEGTKKYNHPCIFINWGKKSLSPHGRGIRRVLNSPDAVIVTSNKLSTFRVFKEYGVPTVGFTTSKATAQTWLEEDGIVYGRSVLNGSSGIGIRVITEDDYSFPTCPLYTRAITGKRHEYRVHVAGGKVIDFTHKRRREGAEANGYVRNLDNGWVFCRDEEILPPAVTNASLMAIISLGLDFGAVDVIYKKNGSRVYVLEVNTAPGLEGTTLTRYTEYFRTLLVRR